MEITDLMTAAITTEIGMTVTDAALLMIEAGVTELAVVDESHALIGIVGEADVFRARLGEEPMPLEHLMLSHPDQGRVVGDIMRRPVLSVQRRDTVGLCATLLTRHPRSLPVLEGTQVVGMITRRALLAALVRSDAAIKVDVTSQLAANNERVGEWAVDVLDGVVTLDGTEDMKAWQAVELGESVDGVARVDVRLRAVPQVNG